MSFQSFIENYKDIVTKKYFCFEGRADRKEFWMFFLANFIINFILGFIPGTVGMIISGVYGLAILLPFIGLVARRLHDTGRSGWMQLLGLIPFVGVIIVIILCALEGQKEANQYGAPVAGGCCCCGCEEKKGE